MRSDECDDSVPALGRRPATQADVPFLLALRYDTMDAQLAAAGEHLDDDAHRARLMHRFDCAQVLTEHDRPVGLIKLLRGESVWEILQFQLAPQLQGRGMGRALLQELIGEAEQAGVVLRLSVLRDNPARRLYASLGFGQIGESDQEVLMQYGGSGNGGPGH